MIPYISFLRGINVSGKNKIKMEVLRELYTSLGLHHVSTYLQSGNVVFTASKKKAAALEKEISSAIEQQLGLQVPVLVRTLEQLNELILQNPYIGETEKNLAFLHVTFFSGEGALTDKHLLSIANKKLPDEEAQLKATTVYLYCPHGYGTTKLHNNFWETQLKQTATTRNWKTINELARIANSLTS